MEIKAHMENIEYCLPISSSDEKFASFASNEAIKSELLSRHGCIAVSSGKIIARGCNSYRTYSYDGFIKDSCSCHAEIDVLRQCYRKNIMKKINLYVVRIASDGSYANSAPCDECIRMIRILPFIKYFIYTDSDGNLIKLKPKDYNIEHQSNGKNAIREKRIKFNVIHKRQKSIHVHS
tara:strand:- start:8778 stop:9311 length:534 start_codon:yes stop_codon:yes gene_type:complete